MRKNKGSLVTALLLIVLGVWYLAIEIYPQIRTFAYGGQTWPWQVIGFGALFILVGLITWTPGLFIPGFIIGGIGGILYYQNLTHTWESWSYAWTLIPSFVGVGLIFFGTLTRRRGALIAGLWNIFSSMILFGIFASAFARLQVAALAWPVGLIVLGVFFLMGAMRRRG